MIFSSNFLIIFIYYFSSILLTFLGNGRLRSLYLQFPSSCSQQHQWWTWACVTITNTNLRIPSAWSHYDYLGQFSHKTYLPQGLCERRVIHPLPLTLNHLVCQSNIKLFPLGFCLKKEFLRNKHNNGNNAIMLKDMINYLGSEEILKAISFQKRRGRIETTH